MKLNHKCPFYYIISFRKIPSSDIVCVCECVKRVVGVKRAEWACMRVNETGWSKTRIKIRSESESGGWRGGTGVDWWVGG